MSAWRWVSCSIPPWEYTTLKGTTVRVFLELRRPLARILYLRMKRRRSLLFGELLVIWSFRGPSLRIDFVSLRLLAILRDQITSGCVVLWTFVGRPLTHKNSSWSWVLKIWNRVVSIHSSDSVSSLPSFKYSFSARLEALSMLLVFLTTSTYVTGMGKVVFGDAQF